MKNGLRAVALVILALQYCFVISFYCSISRLSNHSEQSQSSTERDYYSVVSPTLFCHTNQTANLLDSAQDFSSSFRTNIICDFLSSWNVKEQLEPNRIASYIDYAKTIDAGLDTTSIIYPFHYFL